MNRLDVFAGLVCLLSFASVAPLAQAAAPGTADRTNYANTATNLSEVRTFAAQPNGFDPLNAADEELATYGLPPKPDAVREPTHYQQWARAMQTAKIRWNGSLRPLPQSAVAHSTASAEASGLQPNGEQLQAVGPFSTLSFNWAGVVLTKNLTAYSATQSFRDIYSLMTVPTVQPPFGGGCSSYQQLTFAGLNGYAKKSGVQPGPNGTLMGGAWAEVFCSSSDAVYGAIFGWDPGSLYLSFYTHPGDILYTEVSAPQYGTAQSYLFIEDETTLTYQSYSLAVPPGVKYIGDTAEWIVSRNCCKDDGSPPALANGGQVFFDGGAALDFTGATLYPGSQASTTTLLTMVNDQNTSQIMLVHQGATGQEGNTALRLETTGCAWSGGCVSK